MGFFTLGVTPAVRLSLGIQVEEGAARRRLPVTWEPQPAIRISTRVRPFPLGRPSRLLHAVHGCNKREYMGNQKVFYQKTFYST